MEEERGDFETLTFLIVIFSSRHLWFVSSDSKLSAKPNWCAHADWPKMSGDESSTTTMPPLRDHTLWRITTTRTVEGLSEQPRCGAAIWSSTEAACHRVHKVDKIICRDEGREEWRIWGKGKRMEEYDRGDLFSHERIDRNSGQKVENNFEEALKEVSQSQGIGTKIGLERKEQSSSVAQKTPGIKRKVEQLQETQEQPFLTASGTSAKKGKERSIRRNTGGRKVKKLVKRKRTGWRRLASGRGREAEERDDVSSVKKERKKKLKLEGNWKLNRLIMSPSRTQTCK